MQKDLMKDYSYNTLEMEMNKDHTVKLRKAILLNTVDQEED